LLVDIGNGFGHINSSRSLSRAKKMDCMMNVGRGKFRRTTSNRFREVRAMFRTKPRDGTNAITSRIGYVASRMTSIKHRKDLVLLGKGKSMHDGKWDIISARVLIFILQDDAIM